MEGMATRGHLDHWRHERVGYEDRPTVAYATADRRLVDGGVNWAAWERRAAMLAMFGALVWAFRLSGPGQRDLAKIWETPGITESCGIALLLWIHSWWRSTVRLK